MWQAITVFMFADDTTVIVEVVETITVAPAKLLD